MDSGNKLQPGRVQICRVIFLTSFPYATDYNGHRVAVAAYLIRGGAKKESVHTSQHTSTRFI